MNMTELGHAANRQHRLDADTGAWVPSGKGSKRVHTNYAGYRLTKDERGGWTVWAPNGQRVCREHNLAWAKIEADSHAKGEHYSQTS